MPHKSVSLILMILIQLSAHLTHQTVDHLSNVVAMRQSISIVESNHGKYLYEQDDLNYHFIERGKPPGPFLLRAFVGNDFFSTVQMIDLNRQGAAGGFLETSDPNVRVPLGLTDQELIKILQGLPKLRIVSLVGNNKLTSNCLDTLFSLTELEHVTLDTPHLTPEMVTEFLPENDRINVWLNGEQIVRE